MLFESLIKNKDNSAAVKLVLMNRGFTLIELVVTVTVIMVLAGVGAMSLNNFNGLKELESVREDVSNHIKLAKNLAITKQLPEEETNLEYVKVNIDNNTITIVGVDSFGTTFPNSPYSTMTIDTSEGNSVLSTNNFGFIKSTGRLVDNLGVATSMSVVVSVVGNGGTKTINISNSGIISNGN